MGTKNDVFGLENVYGLQIEGEWASRSDVWQRPPDVLQDNPFGYWAGGMEFISGNTYVFPTSISRLDYSNDTNNAITRGFLHDVNASHYTTLGNSNFGYWAGGHPYVYGSTTPSPKSNIQRLEFGNDTNSILIRSYLDQEVRYSAGSGNNTFGYILGGVKDTEQNGPKVSLVQRISYANDTASVSPKGPLGDIRGNHSAVPSGTNAYIAGGSTGEPTTPTTYETTIERINFSNDTASTSSLGDMRATRTGHFGTGNTTSAYWSGGNAIGLPTTDAKKSERLDYSSDTSNTVYKGSTPIQLIGGGSAGSTTGGYFGGGTSTTPGVFYSSVYRLDYSSDTSSTVGKGNIGSDLFRVSACSSQGNGLTRQTVFSAGNSSTTTVPTGTNFAYFAGGVTNPTTYHSDIQAIDMKNDTVDTKNKASMNHPSPARSSMVAVGNNDNGYFCGGYHPAAYPSSFMSNFKRLDYSNDTARPISIAPSVFPLNVSGGDGASNLTNGYLFGGIGVNNSKFMRLQFSNETTTLMPSGATLFDNLLSCRVTGNQSYAWITGGYHFNPTTTISVVERFDFSSDSAALSPHAALIKERDNHNASGNLNYGYFAGGQYTDYISSIDRIDYSNDTVSQIVTMSSPSRHSYSGSTGNSSGGYYAGGRTNPSTLDDTSLTRRIDYSNDTENPVIKANLIEGNMSNVSGLSAHENGLPETRNDGYEYRAFLFNPITAVDGQYGATNSPRTFDIGDFRETYNSGYIIGGSEPGSSHAANMERLDFTNDTARLQTRGNISDVRNFSHYAGNENFFYQMGGQDPGVTARSSNVYRVSYANDTQFTDVTDLDKVKSEGAAVSTRHKAYIAGGRENDTTVLNDISKLNFSNETLSTAITANLYQARTFLDGTSNDSYGYFGGGTGLPVSVPAIMSTVDRLDFSSDTYNTVNKGSLLEDRSYGLAACGNRYYGYFGGGYTEPGVYHSFISRVDYASDTTNNPARGPLTTAAYQLAATSNSDYGYFMTGAGPGTPAPHFSTTQRLNFSNDTADTLVKGACNYPKNDAGGVSAREHGLAQMGADIVRGPATAYNESVEQTP